MEITQEQIFHLKFAMLTKKLKISDPKDHEKLMKKFNQYKALYNLILLSSFANANFIDNNIRKILPFKYRFASLILNVIIVPFPFFKSLARDELKVITPYFAKYRDEIDKYFNAKYELEKGLILPEEPEKKLKQTQVKSEESDNSYIYPYDKRIDYTNRFQSKGVDYTGTFQNSKDPEPKENPADNKRITEEPYSFYIDQAKKLKEKSAIYPFNK
jgi:hypothetical protein